jgi:hypothetical protein
MAWLLKLAAGLLACSAIAQSAATYHVTVDANDELCFFEDLEVNDSLGMSFQVTFGGFLDIDVEVCSGAMRRYHGNLLPLAPHAFAHRIVPLDLRLCIVPLYRFAAQMAKLYMKQIAPLKTVR